MEDKCALLKARERGWNYDYKEEWNVNGCECPKCGHKTEFLVKGPLGKLFCRNCDYVSNSIPKLKNYYSRTNSSLNNWANKIKKRDGYVCVLCGNNDEVEAHHMYPRKDFPEYTYEYWNGITLCKNCHKMIHEKIRSVYEKEPVAYRTGQNN